MKKLAAALAAVLLAGCAATDSTGNILLTSPMPVGQGPVSSGMGKVAAVVRGAQTACNYRPSAAIVAGIVSIEPLATPIDAIVNAICAGVAPLAYGPGMRGVRQGYARVNGHYYSLVPHRNRPGR